MRKRFDRALGQVLLNIDNQKIELTRAEIFDELIEKAERHVRSEAQIAQLIERNSSEMMLRGEVSQVKRLEQLRREARSDAVDVVAAAIAHGPTAFRGEVEGVYIKGLSEQDQELLALLAANKLVEQWLSCLREEKEFFVTPAYIKLKLVDVIRSDYLFGRRDRLAAKERVTVSFEEIAEE